MAELPNSPPPKAAVRPSGPVFHENVAKVRVTSAMAENYDFRGKTIDRDGEPLAVSSLGWDHESLAAAELDPQIVIERFDKEGRRVKKNGTPYPSVSDLTPKPAPKREES